VYIKVTAESGLLKPSSADTFQVRSISKKRLVKKLGTLSPAVMEKTNQGLTISLSLDKYKGE
jgi:mRNA interferase MazF